MHMSANKSPLIPSAAQSTGKQNVDYKMSIENLKDLYNPTDNTINLTKLSVALKLETPLKEPAFAGSGRVRSVSVPENEETLASILSLTL